MRKRVGAMKDPGDLYAVNAGYRKCDIGTNWYYVFANDVKEAQKRFLSRIVWLDIYRIEKCSDEKKEEILKNSKWHVII